MSCVTVLGIDPGSRHTGWGIISEVSGVLSLVECGVINTPSNTKMFSERLCKIYYELDKIISGHKVDEVAIEQVFVAKNAMSALKLGQARGVAVATCAVHKILVYDYEPTIIKKSIVGVGRAEKEQVAFMVRRLLNIRDNKWSLDTTDALAVAICHLSMRRFQQVIPK